jgi:hypothetical protein
MMLIHTGGIPEIIYKGVFNMKIYVHCPINTDGEYDYKSFSSNEIIGEYKAPAGRSFSISCRSCKSGTYQKYHYFNKGLSHDMFEYIMRHKFVILEFEDYEFDVILEEEESDDYYGVTTFKKALGLSMMDDARWSK